MKEVSKDYFYSKIGSLNVVLTVVEPFPYKTEFKTRAMETKGYTQDYTEKGRIKKKYFTNL